MTLVDYLFIYVVVTVAVTTTLMAHTMIHTYFRRKRAEEILNQIQETIDSEIKFRKIVSNLNMNDDS
jgi:hypothetical protein